MVERLLLDERIQGDGHLARTYATFVDGQVHIEDEGAADPARGSLSIAAVDRVMARYGLPLEAGVHPDREALDLGGGRRLRRLRYHAKVDAEGRDYLVWERPGEEPLAVIATHATAALRYLVLRLGGERSQESEA
ncbi:MAG TPA: hypothetical protein VLB44_01060 [Kofleriaceae bacterium]|nr:hypothetical protein [Kofleriaceae bacterium]